MAINSTLNATRGTFTQHNQLSLKYLFVFLLFAMVGLNGFGQETVIDTLTGNRTFEVPCGVTKIDIELWGGGGAGGYSSERQSGGAGGKAGVYTKIENIVVSQGDIFTYTIGAGAGPSGEYYTPPSQSTKISEPNVSWETLAESSGGTNGQKNMGEGISATAGENATNGGLGGAAAPGGNSQESNITGKSGQAPGGGGGGGFKHSNGSNNGPGGNGGNGGIRITLYTGTDYCTPTINTVEPITNVTIANTNNTTSNSLSEDAFETFFCDDPVTLIADTTTSISIQGNTNGNNTNYITAFFDWNYDGDYNDNNEKFDLGTITNSTGQDGQVLTTEINVPATSTYGTSKLRIVKSNSPINNACDNIVNGQIEEYILTVEDCTKIWVANEDSNWNNPNNWQPTGVPTSGHCVHIAYASTTFPIIDNTDAFAYSVFKEYNGELIIRNNSTLTVTETFKSFAPVLISNSEVSAKSWNSNGVVLTNSYIDITDGDLEIGTSGTYDNNWTDSTIIVNGKISTAEGGEFRNCTINASDLEFKNAGGNSLHIYESTLHFTNHVENNIGDFILDEGSIMSCLTLTNNNSGSNLEVLGESILTIANKFDNQTTMYIDSGSSLIQINETDTNTRQNTTEFNFMMDRTAYTERSTDYVYWSAPTQAFNLDNISTTSHRYLWIPTVDNADKYESNFGNWEKVSNITMETGKGYIVRRGPTYTVSFLGQKPNNGTLTTPVSRGDYNGGSYTNGPSSTTVSNEDDNWNLIGNPYPSAINITTFLTENVDVLEGGVRIWTHGTAISKDNDDPFYEDFVYNYNTNDYLTITASGSSDPSAESEFIASGQGFFVTMKHVGTGLNENVTFTNAMRTYSDYYTNTEFYRTTQTDDAEKHRIWMNLSDSNNTSTNMLIGYIEGATNEKDELYDSVIMDHNVMSFYSLIDDEAMVVQGRSIPFMDTDVVSLGIITTKKDIYTIGISKVDGVFETTNQDIYLKDLYENKVHDLRAAPYQFSSEIGTFNDRFVLVYEGDKLSIDDTITLNDLNIFANKNYIKISSKTDVVNTVTIYDILGRTLFNAKNMNTQDVLLDQFAPTNSPLIVKATLANGKTKTQKVIF
ncbi:GEVED domain-containing protein [Formosa sp. A9]|uniref:GEVED domain-containing protein n=1 Tax=Formosa sp. A9 TaxID=3442641 RepID=UPI003EBCAE6A